MTDNLGRRYKHQQRERNIRNLQKGIHIAQQYKKWTEKYTRHIQQKIKQRKVLWNQRQGSENPKQ